MKKSRKIGDEYFMVKDFALAKENLPGIRRPVTGAYPSNQGRVYGSVRFIKVNTIQRL